MVNDLKIGDIVFCKMPTEIIKQCNIRENHQERPYIVISNNDNKILGLACSTKKLESLTYPLLVKNYPKLNHDGFINFSNELHQIPITNIKKYKGQISNKDFSYLIHFLKIKINQGYYSSEIIPIGYRNDNFYEIGDVLKVDNMLWFILMIDGKKAKCVNIDKNIDFTQIKTITLDDSIILYDHKNDEFIKNILELYKKYLKTTILTKAKIGDVISYNNNLFYINSEDKNQYYGYMLRQTFETNCIQINNLQYTIDPLSYHSISKNSYDFTIYNTSKQEQITLSNAKTDYKNSLKITNKNTNKFAIGTIVSILRNSKYYDKFIVLAYNNSYFYAVKKETTSPHIFIFKNSKNGVSVVGKIENEELNNYFESVKSQFGENDIINKNYNLELKQKNKTKSYKLNNSNN